MFFIRGFLPLRLGLTPPKSIKRAALLLPLAFDLLSFRKVSSLGTCGTSIDLLEQSRGSLQSSRTHWSAALKVADGVRIAWRRIGSATVPLLIHDKSTATVRQLRNGSVTPPQGWQDSSVMAPQRLPKDFEGDFRFLHGGSEPVSQNLRDSSALRQFQDAFASDSKIRHDNSAAAPKLLQQTTTVP